MGQIYGDRWEIVRQLSEGGQAHTFIVKDRKGEGETDYVLKRLKNIKRLDRFKKEIEAVRNLSHENIVQLVDFDLEDDKPYLVTEYCAGGSLEKVSTDKKPFWHDHPIRALELFEQICQGVAYAHRKGTIHRDLKPANIFLRTENGPAVVGDFGLCYLERDGTRMTSTEEAVGPWLYMAPELEDGRVELNSKKSDIYSLGKLLYWLISGRIFSREKHRDEKWNLAEKNVSMEHINRLLDTMIVTDPKQRSDLSKILEALSVTRRLVEKGFNPISKSLPQLCTYCGQGVYVVHEGKFNIRKFGLQSGELDWRILVCSMCGHVQYFKTENAILKQFWLK